MSTNGLPRFDRTERAVHWATAVLVLVLLGTGAALYAGPVSTLIGRRDLMRLLHVVAGLALPVPVVAAALMPRRGRALRADARTLDRFDREDWRALVGRRAARAGKFTPGQKLNAAFLAGAGVVSFGTGVMLRWPDPFRDELRTGATFVHDWFAIGIGIAVAAHIGLALRDPEAMRGMTRGRVSASWARRRHPRWYEAVTGRGADRLRAPHPREPNPREPNPREPNP